MRGSFQRQRGFFVGYILFGIALISIAMTGLAMMTRDAGQRAYLHKVAGEVVKQVQVVRNVVAQCAMLHPTGDNGTGFAPKFPGGSSVAVSTLECPGAPYANKNLWTGRDGVHLPLTPTGFTGWNYTNDAAGIKIELTSSGGMVHNQVLANAATKFASTEVAIAGNVFTYWIVKN